MEELDALHDYIMVVVVLISYLLIVLAGRIVTAGFLWKTFSTSHRLEVFWTVMPAFILVGLAVPSLQLLYVLDEGPDSQSLSYKVVGHQ